MSHPVRPESYIEMNNFYTVTVYEKGAEVIRMIFEILGKDLFRKGMDLYFERFDGQAVTTEDFLKTMEDVSKIDLSQFKLWYSQSGTPYVTMKREYNFDTKKLYIHLSQEILPDKNQSFKKPMHIPIKFGLINKHGKDITPEKRSLLNLKKAQETFVFENISQGTIPSILRGFSAPVILKTDFSSDELAFLMAHDTDEFNKWDAAQKLYFMQINSVIKAIENDEPLKLDSYIVEALSKSLCNESADKALDL